MRVQQLISALTESQHQSMQQSLQSQAERKRKTESGIYHPLPSNVCYPHSAIYSQDPLSRMTRRVCYLITSALFVADCLNQLSPHSNHKSLKHKQALPAQLI